ncbi:MAG: hypothetical protein ACREUE_18285, partial [Panacagrimonas sp.]
SHFDAFVGFLYERRTGELPRPGGVVGVRSCPSLTPMDVPASERSWRRCASALSGSSGVLSELLWGNPALGVFAIVGIFTVCCAVYYYFRVARHL